MKSIPCIEIHIAPARQRVEFDPVTLLELRESIETHGLLHPVILRKDGDRFVLVAGERRLRAVLDLYDLGGVLRHDSEFVPHGSIPYVLLGELDELAREEAEWDENNKRVDLTWPEQAAATAKLSSIRARQAERAGLPPPSPPTIAEELRGNRPRSGLFEQEVRKEILVAKHLADPEVAKARTLEDAWKVLKKREQVRQNEDLAASVGLTFSSDLHRAYHGESENILPEWTPEQFEVILTDPPYGMDADEFGDSGGLAAGAHGYKDDAEVVERILGWFPVVSLALAKPNAHLYVFCDIDWFPIWKTSLARAGWRVFRTPFVWHKPNGARAPWPDKGPQRKYELCLFAMKGSLPVQKMLGDVLTYPADENLGHAAQKPVGLYADLLSRSVQPGMKVLDCFSGTGTIFPAADRFKCAAVGVERAASPYAIGLRRIAELKEIAIDPLAEIMK